MAVDRSPYADEHVRKAGSGGRDVRVAMVRQAGKKKSCLNPFLSNMRLDKLIERAIVDASGELKQIVGFYTMLDNNIAMPIYTKLLGVEVIVEYVDMSDDERIVAVCVCGKSFQRVPIIILLTPDPPSAGVRRNDAFRRWTRGR
jgi:hypothetical protein